MKKSSLTFRIFINTFLTGALVYFICAFLFVSDMYDYFEKQIYSELETESTFLENYALNEQFDHLDALETSNRITLIHPNGQVYYDNTVDASTLENHFTRQEVMGALEKGKATSSRFSSTMIEKTLYFAKVMSSGDIIRVSCNQHSIWVMLLGLSHSLLVMLVIAVIISAFSASWISKKITEPLNKINLENPEESDVYEELKPFTKRIAEENYEKSQREELRQQFTANVSHELKTPLTSISGFAEILKEGGTDQQTTKDFASTIYDESQRMITLVNDIIKLSKLDEKSISLEKEEVNLRTLCQEIIQQLSPVAQHKNITVNLSASLAPESSSAFTIMAVQPVVYEMVYNLIENAIKYNVSGGKVQVNLKNLPEDKKLILSVKDTGIGIPEGEKDRIFERFYRVDKSRSKENGGTGLGLSIVKHAAKYHDAKISVQSQLGKGSTFTVEFKI